MVLHASHERYRRTSRRFYGRFHRHDSCLPARLTRAARARTAPGHNLLGRSMIVRSALSHTPKQDARNLRLIPPHQSFTWHEILQNAAARRPFRVSLPGTMEAAVVRPLRRHKCNQNYIYVINARSLGILGSKEAMGEKPLHFLGAGKLDSQQRTRHNSEQ